MKKKNTDKKELLTIREVSELFGVHQETLRRWDRQGKLKAVRVGKVGHRKYPRERIMTLMKKDI